MAEYIEREDVIKKISGLTVNISGGRRNAKEICAEAIKFYHQAILQCVNVSPAVDVEKVVYCKDCKHLYCHSAVDREFYCRNIHGMKGCLNPIEENPFCSYGERAEK